MTKSFSGESNIEDWKKLSPKDGALRFIEFMEKNARRTLSDKALGQEEKKTLTNAMEGLRPAFELLNASMGTQADARYTALSWLMGILVTISQHVGFLDIRAQDFFRPIIESEGQRRRGADGGKASGDARHPSMLISLISKWENEGKLPPRKRPDK